LNLHTLFAVDAVLSLAAGVTLLAFARQGARRRRPGRRCASRWQRSAWR
jgi:hypothetical protein